MSAESRSSFKSSIREATAKYMHPLIESRDSQLREGLSKALGRQERIATTAGYKSRYPELFPLESDQHLVLTPFDNVDGLEVGIPPAEQIEGWSRMREFNLRLANHPERIAAMKALEERGFIPPKKLTGIIDRILERGMIPQLSDLGHNADVLDGDTDRSQVHRTELLANGPFSFVGRNARSYVGLGAMPDINGSTLALETAAKMHALAEVPEVGVFTDFNKQAKLAKSVLDRLTTNDPLLDDFSDADRKFIVDHWRASVVGVLEVDADKAMRRAEVLYNAGVRSFRPYGHSVGKDIIDTTKTLRDNFGDEVEVFSSQITNIYTARACEEAGANAVIIGVGSGGRCTTAELSQLIPSNAALAWRLRGEIGIPVIGEGGAVDDVVISILVGMSGVNGSGSIGGGTFEAPGGLFFFTKDGRFYKPYGGEASDRTKWLSGRTYPTGIPYFPEGEQSYKQLTPFEESMSQKLLYHWGRIILGAVIMGVNEKENTISAMQNLDPSPLFEKSPTTQRLQGTH